MTKTACFVITLGLCLSMASADAETIRGTVLDSSGKAMEGVMVSAFD